MEDKEVWKPIPGYEGLYEVSSLGRVKSLDRIVFHERYKKDILYKSCLLKSNISTTGYKIVRLYFDKKQSTYKIHRLVAMTFLNEVKGKCYVNHIDGDKLNNKLSNLEYVSNRENSSHNKVISKIGSSFVKKYNKYYSCIRINGKSVNLGYYDTEEEAHEAYLKALKEYGIENKYATQNQEKS